MRQFKIVAAVALAVILQTSLLTKWEPLVHINLPLIVVVYFALQRDLIEALIIGAITGIVTDAFSNTILGAGGFSKTLVAFAIATLAIKVNLDNPMMRIPVLAGAVIIDSTLTVLLNRLFGQHPNNPFIVLLAYNLIGTMIAGTVILFLLEQLFSDKALLRRQFAQRRKMARRNTVNLTRKGFRFGRRR
jgi:rod shape-determining protein MreD